MYKALENYQHYALDSAASFAFDYRGYQTMHTPLACTSYFFINNETRLNCSNLKKHLEWHYFQLQQ